MSIGPSKCHGLARISPARIYANLRLDACILKHHATMLYASQRPLLTATVSQGMAALAAKTARTIGAIMARSGA